MKDQQVNAVIAKLGDDLREALDKPFEGGKIKSDLPSEESLEATYTELYHQYFEDIPVDVGLSVDKKSTERVVLIVRTIEPQRELSEVEQERFDHKLHWLHVNNLGPLLPLNYIDVSFKLVDPGKEENNNDV